jgi:hypothetical protein
MLRVLAQSGELMRPGEFASPCRRIWKNGIKRGKISVVIVLLKAYKALTFFPVLNALKKAQAPAM